MRLPIPRSKYTTTSIEYRRLVQNCPDIGQLIQNRIIYIGIHVSVLKIVSISGWMQKEHINACITNLVVQERRNAIAIIPFGGMRGPVIQTTIIGSNGSNVSRFVFMLLSPI